MKLVAAGVLSLSILSANAQSGVATLPTPPCGTNPHPEYAEVDSPPVVRLWRGGEIDGGWVPPGCTGWKSPGFRDVLAVAGRFRHGGSSERLLLRFAAVSEWTTVRYWSVSETVWRPLITAATALSGPDTKLRRSDFDVGEIKAGADYFLSQADSRSTGEVVYRLEVLERRANRLVVGLENVSPVKAYLVTLFHPGDLQSVYFFDRFGPDIWGYYSLSGTREGASLLTRGHEASYVNRATALYRYFAGLPAESGLPNTR